MKRNLGSLGGAESQPLPRGRAGTFRFGAARAGGCRTRWLEGRWLGGGVFGCGFAAPRGAVEGERAAGSRGEVPGGRETVSKMEDGRLRLITGPEASAGGRRGHFLKNSA